MIPWNRFNRTVENPYAYRWEPGAPIQGLLSYAEGLKESAIISDYRILNAQVAIDNASGLTFDPALRQIRSGADILYQAPVGTTFVVALNTEVILTVPVAVTYVRGVTTAGNILTSVLAGQIRLAANALITNVTNALAANVTSVVLSILEYET